MSEQMKGLSHEQAAGVNHSREYHVEEPAGMAAWLDVHPGVLARKYTDQLIRDDTQALLAEARRNGQQLSRQEYFSELQAWIYRAGGEEALQELYWMDSRADGDNTAVPAGTEAVDKAASGVSDYDSGDEEEASCVLLEPSDDELTMTEAAGTRREATRSRVGHAIGVVAVCGRFSPWGDIKTWSNRARGSVHRWWDRQRHNSGPATPLDERCRNPEFKRQAAAGVAAVVMLAVTDTETERYQAEWPEFYQDTHTETVGTDDLPGAERNDLDSVAHAAAISHTAGIAASSRPQEVAVPQNNVATEAEPSGQENDIFTIHTLPEGYIRDLDDKYAVHIMSGEDTDSAWKAAQHIQAAFLEREPSGIDVQRLFDYLPQIEFETGKVLEVSKDVLETVNDDDYEINTDFSGDPHEYIEEVARVAHEVGTEYDLPAEALLAQSAHESGWGASTLSSEANNFFGIKTGSSWDGEVRTLPTREVVNERSITIEDDFRAYNSVRKGFEGYAEFIHGTSRYEAALIHDQDPERYIQSIFEAGYATDPDYVDKVHQTIGEVRNILDDIGFEFDTGVHESSTDHITVRDDEPDALTAPVTQSSEENSGAGSVVDSVPETVTAEPRAEIGADVRESDIEERVEQARSDAESLSLVHSNALRSDKLEAVEGSVRMSEAGTVREDDSKESAEAGRSQAQGDGGEASDKNHEDGNTQDEEADEKAAQRLFVYPLDTTREAVKDGAQGMVWCYDRRQSCHHNYNAADIFVEPDTPVVAARKGTVVRAVNQQGGVGSRVAIRSEIDGHIFYYAHMTDGSVELEVGDEVEAGEEIGTVGESVQAMGTPPHLHFDVLTEDYNGRVTCSGAACREHRFLNPQPALTEAFQKLPVSE